MRVSVPEWNQLQKEILIKDFVVVIVVVVVRACVNINFVVFLNQPVSQDLVWHSNPPAWILTPETTWSVVLGVTSLTCARLCNKMAALIFAQIPSLVPSSRPLIQCGLTNILPMKQTKSWLKTRPNYRKSSILSPAYLISQSLPLCKLNLFLKSLRKRRI